MPPQTPTVAIATPTLAVAIVYIRRCKFATNNGIFANGLDVIIFSTSPGLESKPNPIGMEMEMAGRASSVLEISAVARLFALKTEVKTKCEGEDITIINSIFYTTQRTQE